MFRHINGHGHSNMDTDVDISIDTFDTKGNREQ